MNRRHNCAITVRGDEHTWSLNMKAPEEHIKAWWGDGLDVAIVTHKAPEWAWKLGIAKVWFKVQDCLDTVFPFKWGDTAGKGD